MADDKDSVRDEFAERPGVGGVVQQLLNERANAEAYGDEPRVEQLTGQLDALGHKSAKRAAAARKQAADDSDDDAKASPPAGRRSSPKQNT